MSRSASHQPTITQQCTRCLRGRRRRAVYILRVRALPSRLLKTSQFRAAAGTSFFFFVHYPPSSVSPPWRSCMFETKKQFSPSYSRVELALRPRSFQRPTASSSIRRKTASLWQPTARSNLANRNPVNTDASSLQTTLSGPLANTFPLAPPSLLSFALSLSLYRALTLTHRRGGRTRGN